MSRVELLRPVAAEVIELRPDWALGNVLNALMEVGDDHRVEEIRHAALRAAKHPDSRTPAAINFPVHWQEPRRTPGPFRADPLPECANCGQPRQRHRTGCQQSGCTDPEHELPPPMRCLDCGEPRAESVFRERSRIGARRTADGTGWAVPPNQAWKDARAALKAKLGGRDLFEMPADVMEGFERGPDGQLLNPPWEEPEVPF